MAFTMIGQESITSLADDSDSGRVASLMYPRYRDAILQSLFWNGSLKRASLAAVTGTPEFGFSNHHQLPADFLRLRAVKGDPAYRIEQLGRIYSNESDIKILYVYRVENPAELGDLYADALATRLASVFAMRFRNAASGSMFWRIYKEKLEYAQYIDSGQNQQDVLVADGWTVVGRTGLPAEYSRTDI